MLKFQIDIVNDLITIEEIIATITKLGVEANDVAHARAIITNETVYGECDEDDLKLYIYGE